MYSPIVSKVQSCTLKVIFLLLLGPSSSGMPPPRRHGTDYDHEHNTTGCGFGAHAPGPSVPHTEAGNYLDLNHPAQCPGNVTAWLFCHYPQTYSIQMHGYVYRAFFRIWRPTDSTKHLYSLVYEHIPAIVVNNNDIEEQFLCVNVSLSGSNVAIKKGDILGVLIPDFSSLAIPGLSMIANNVEGYGLFRQTQPLSLENISIHTSSLQEEPFLGLHLHTNVTYETDTCLASEDNCHNTLATCSAGGSGSSECICITGYTGDGVTCTNIDECAVGVAICDDNADCVDTEGSYECVCRTGYTRVGSNCSDINECSTLLPYCVEHAHCTNTDGGYMCTCDTGYNGDGFYYCYNIDECFWGMTSCDENADCVDNVGSYECVCRTGYTGNGLSSCIDVDECSESATASYCVEHAHCNNTDGSYMCICDAGYSGDGFYYCFNVDECSVGGHSCHENADCVDTEGSYECVCRTPYTGTGRNCTDIDDCSVMSQYCVEHAHCINTDGSYTCTCDLGYSGDGFYDCYSIDECLVGMASCDDNADCVNTDGSYECVCRAGYTWNGSNCTVDECSLIPLFCGEHSHCTNTDGSYMCTCDAGYSGDTSCHNIDECSLGVASCAENAECLDTDGSYECLCSSGYTGNGTSCTYTHMCSEDTASCDENADCVNTEGGYECVCRTGYIGDGFLCISDPQASDGSTTNPGNSGLISGTVMAIVVLLVVIFSVASLFAFTYYRQKRAARQHLQALSTGNLVHTRSDEQETNTGSEHSLHSSYAHYERESVIAQYSVIDEEPQPYEYSCPSAPKWTVPEEYFSYSGPSMDTSQILRQTLEQENIYENISPYCVPATQEERLYVQIKSYGIEDISNTDIHIIGHLGSGQFGSVKKALWMSQNKVLEVAVKTLTDTANAVKFLQEAAIMAQFKHPNIVHLHGVVYTENVKMFVVELMHNGDLALFLKSLRPDPGELVSCDTSKCLLEFSKQIALGMNYLASKGFVHRDLAARNILVSKKYICKISDFGMSRDLAEDEYYISHGGRIPVKWTAPEALQYKKYSTASDMWSYGCVLYEIWSLGHKPFEDINNIQAIQHIKSGYRLPPPPGCPRTIYKVMIQCWRLEPSLRPEYRDVLRRMTSNEDALAIPQGDIDSSHSQAGVLGAPLKCGQHLYRDLQDSFISNK